MQASNTLDWHYPAKLEPLTRPARYKDAVGGRGGAKSHFYAELLILRCFARPTRAVCIREVQLSIADSVRQLLVDKIAKFGLIGAFDVLENKITCRHNGSFIIFRGMQSYNAETIKSLEGFDVAWVEEAQVLSEHSLSLLRPTIRNEGSEIWFSRNRRHRTDAVDVFMRSNIDQPGYVSVEINWMDNPWFPDVLYADMLRDYETDPEAAEHVWGGAYGVERGAILARWVDRVERAGRISDAVDYDPDGPGIEISSDIGFRDTATWWFWQRRINGFSVLDYDGESGLDAGEWIERLQTRLIERKWRLKKIWLPHDATHKVFQTKHTAAEQFAAAFGVQKVGIVRQSLVSSRIEAGRKIIQTCEFHKTRCEEGLNGLRAWHYEWDPETQTFSKNPAHDAASHPGDGFTYGCQVMQGLPEPKPQDNPNKTHPLAIANLIAEQRRKRLAAEG